MFGSPGTTLRGVHAKLVHPSIGAEVERRLVPHHHVVDVIDAKLPVGWNAVWPLGKALVEEAPPLARLDDRVDGDACPVLEDDDVAVTEVLEHDLTPPRMGRPATAASSHRDGTPMRGGTLKVDATGVRPISRQSHRLHQ